MTLNAPLKIPYGLLALVVVQILCAAFFTIDIFQDYREYAMHGASMTHLYIEVRCGRCDARQRFQSVRRGGLASDLDIGAGRSRCTENDTMLSEFQSDGSKNNR